MAGLLNLVPRYLPRYGMAPDWARASRPLVLVFVVISFLVTLIFHASVDAQAGAYATGVLVLMSSAAIAVTISFWTSWMRWGFLLISLVFAYTTFSNMVQRPEGIKIAAIFIGLIIATSLISRAFRSTELRIGEIALDDASREFLIPGPRPGNSPYIPPASPSLSRGVRIARCPRTDGAQSQLQRAVALSGN
jgi:hypothetical protein